jgi:ZIP family zinc transporter
MIEAILLSLAAGLSTGVGALITFLLKKPGKGLLGFSLGFASGVMLLVSFFGLLNKAIEITSFLSIAIAFSLGSMIALALDNFVPHIFTFEEKEKFKGRLLRVGVLIALGIALHNVPEGFAVSASYSHERSLGLLMAIAIALHNVPEGIVCGIPLIAARVDRAKILKLSLLSGLAEPLGALVGALLGFAFHGIVGVMLAFAAGLMVYLTSDELIPTAHRYGHEHSISFGLLLGLIFMLLVSKLFYI